MRKFSRKYKVKYNLELENKSIRRESGVCFARITDWDNGEIEYIEIFNINCKETYEFRDRYLKYIGDMLHLEYEIKENSFRFKAVKNNTSNLAICTMVRMLWEGETDEYLEHFLIFFKNLLVDGRCKYRNKLARYCHFYSLIRLDYFSTGHGLYHPQHVAIRYYKDFKQWSDNKGVLYSVNQFFNENY